MIETLEKVRTRRGYVRAPGYPPSPFIPCWSCDPSSPHNSWITLCTLPGKPTPECLEAICPEFEQPAPRLRGRDLFAA